MIGTHAQSWKTHLVEQPAKLVGDRLILVQRSGSLYYGASSLVCVPVSLAQNGPALGAQAGEKRLREIIIDQGGFSTMRRATETPFNIVLEARP
jgi:hypothetical protein